MSHFVCPKCGMTNIDCGRDGYKTEREIELEKKLDESVQKMHILEKKLGIVLYTLDMLSQLGKQFGGRYKEIANDGIKRIEEIEK